VAEGIWRSRSSKHAGRLQRSAEEWLVGSAGNVFVGGVKSKKNDRGAHERVRQIQPRVTEESK
jgi:hypothetical protein